MGARGDSGIKPKVGMNPSLLLFDPNAKISRSAKSRASLLHHRQDNEGGSESVQPGRHEQRRGLCNNERRVKWH